MSPAEVARPTGRELARIPTRCHTGTGSRREPIVKKFEKVAERIGELTAYALANTVESACEGGEARAFFEGIGDSYAEAIIYAEGKPDDDAEHEIADGAPDIYNHTRMMQLVETRAYLDTSDLATGNEDIVTLAGYVLYDLAREVVAHLAELFDEYADEIDDDE
ncbi:hypothetical protein ACFWGP_05425 [Agromyces sp. NPDC127015]|uniref:hypothetical protein n=1 Tax=Agromyces sp. NPDC127015 TaxID=3347108 RepID=UPI003647C357